MTLACILAVNLLGWDLGKLGHGIKWLQVGLLLCIKGYIGIVVQFGYWYNIHS